MIHDGGIYLHPFSWDVTIHEGTRRVSLKNCHANERTELADRFNP